MHIFFNRRFLLLFLLVANNFCQILIHILLGFYILKPVVKNQGGLMGVFLSYFALKVLSRHFPEIAAQ
jgi:hypothetical protein